MADERAHLVLADEAATHLLGDDLDPACGNYPSEGGMRLTPVLADVTCTGCRPTLPRREPGATLRALCPECRMLQVRHGADGSCPPEPF